MIVDVLPNQYEKFANKHHFKPWQSGLLGDMVSSKNTNQFRSINMGRNAGHTYFARMVASVRFPLRTKIYVACQKNMREYGMFLFSSNKVHEPIESLDSDGFVGYDGNQVEFVVIDMGFENINRFEKAISTIKRTIPENSRILVMQPNFSNLF